MAKGVALMRMVYLPIARQSMRAKQLATVIATKVKKIAKIIVAEPTVRTLLTLHMTIVQMAIQRAVARTGEGVVDNAAMMRKVTLPIAMQSNKAYFSVIAIATNLNQIAKAIVADSTMQIRSQVTTVGTPQNTTTTTPHHHHPTPPPQNTTTTTTPPHAQELVHNLAKVVWKAIAVQPWATLATRKTNIGLRAMRLVSKALTLRIRSTTRPLGVATNWAPRMWMLRARVVPC